MISQAGFSQDVPLFPGSLEFKLQSSILHRKIAGGRSTATPTLLPFTAYSPVQTMLGHSDSLRHLPNRILSVDHLARPPRINGEYQM